MKHIYLISQRSKGQMFGIGTYIKSLLSIIKNEDFVFHTVQLNAEQTEVTVEIIDDIEQILIPNPVLAPETNRDLKNYHINAVRILSKYIDLNATNIFHLNYLNLLHLAESIKRYLNGWIVLTIHYSQPLMEQNFNIEELRQIIASSESDNDLPVYNTVQKEVSDIRFMIKNYIDKVISVAGHSFLTNREIYQIEDDKNIMIYNVLADVKNETHIPKRELKRKLGIHTDEKIIIYAGRLDEVKGVQCLLQALAVLKEKGIKFHLFVSGKGHYDATLFFIKGLYTNVTFTGFLEKEELYKLYSISDIGVMPSLYEEFGYVLLEMMMHKLPVIAFNTSGPSEIIKNNHTGFLVELNKENADISIYNLADKIEYLLKHEMERVQMGENAAMDVLSKFNVDVFRRKMTCLYNSLTDPHLDKNRKFSTSLGQNINNKVTRTNITRISVVVPIYNACSFLRETIDSILAQSLPDFELLALDDGSTDSSADIVGSYSEPRIRYVKCPHDFIGTVNRGFSLSKGKYIALLDHDDLMLPGRLQLQYDFMESNPDIAACGGYMTAFGRINGELRVPLTYSGIIKGFITEDMASFFNSTGFIRREILEKYGIGYKRGYSFAADLKFWSDVVKVGKVVNIPQPLILDDVPYLLF